MARFRTNSRVPQGWWRGPDPQVVTDPVQVARAVSRLGRPLFVLERGGAWALAHEGTVGSEPGTGLPVLASVGPLLPESLGASGFRAEHDLRCAYLTGAMAGGIGSVEIVEAMARAGLMGFFGAAGLDPGVVEAAIDRLGTGLGTLPWGANLIHSPQEPRLEEAIAGLYLRRGVRRVEASAYLGLTLPIVRYRVAGLSADPSGRVVARNHVFAKVSRLEIARQFLSPPPPALLAQLVARGDIGSEQARMAARVPMAQDVTVEADSGGHTDNRPALTLLPGMLALRDRMQTEHGYDVPLRIGAAGGLGTPHAVAAAFGMGVDYVLTGSINQGCREAGTSDTVRRMLADADQTDVAMAPAADMFEMGVQLQVLKRGTMFPMRARRLYELHRAHAGIDELPPAARESLEQTVFRAPLEAIWAQTEEYWRARDPDQLERAQREPRHRMALLFRWYLGMSSRWANAGEPGRETDYQVWCGPAMGAFNEWVRGSHLEDWRERRVVDVANNLLLGAAILRRVGALRDQGLELPSAAIDLRPRTADEMAEALA
jgi:PfaD family protein